MRRERPARAGRLWQLGAVLALGCTAGNPDFAVRAEGGARWDVAAADTTAEIVARPDAAARMDAEDAFVPAGIDAAGADEAEPAHGGPPQEDAAVIDSAPSPVVDVAPELLVDLAPELPPVDLAPPAPAGLRGEYYDGRDFARLIFSRVDPTIDFDWGNNAVDARLPADRFSVRWTGSVTPRASERTTFFTSSDDGVRLWLDGVLVIDRWVNQPFTEHAATVALVAGRPVRIRLEYYDNTAAAVARLSWASSSQSKEIVPAAQLTP